MGILLFHNLVITAIFWFLLFTRFMTENYTFISSNLFYKCLLYSNKYRSWILLKREKWLLSLLVKMCGGCFKMYTCVAYLVFVFKRWSRVRQFIHDIYFQNFIHTSKWVKFIQEVNSIYYIRTRPNVLT